MAEKVDQIDPDEKIVEIEIERLKRKEQCIWIRGNHDHWLADYIYRYYILQRNRSVGNYCRIHTIPLNCWRKD